MKKLIILHGPPGVGKTTIGKILYQQINHSALLDADELWRIHPFTVTEKSKQLVERNIRFVMDEYQKSSLVETIVFVWVIPNITLLERIKEWFSDMEIYVITLLCSQEEFNSRRQHDNRPYQDMSINQYDRFNTIKIDTTMLTKKEVVKQIISLTRETEDINE